MPVLSLGHAGRTRYVQPGSKLRLRVAGQVLLLLGRDRAEVVSVGANFYPPQSWNGSSAVPIPLRDLLGVYYASYSLVSQWSGSFSKSRQKIKHYCECRPLLYHHSVVTAVCAERVVTPPRDIVIYK